MRVGSLSPPWYDDYENIDLVELSLSRWWGDLYDVNFNKPVTLKQGDIEAVRMPHSDFLIISASPSQKYPTDTYVASDFSYAGDYYAFEEYGRNYIVYKGEEHWFEQVLLGGTYGWIYSEGFPVDIYGVTVDSLNGNTTRKVVLYSRYHYPRLAIDSDNRLVNYVIREGFNGFHISEQESFTLTRTGDVTYTCTRFASGTGYDISPVPSQLTEDRENPWLMTWSGGSCYVLLYHGW